MTPGELRDEVWTRLTRARVAAYPLPVFGHHPNFSGATEAATRLFDHLLRTGRLAAGDTVLSYPDYVLKSLRKLALEHGVHLVVPAKHLKGWRFLEAGTVKPEKASSIAGAEVWGHALDTLPTCRMLFLACVAVDEEGRVLDKGYGFRPDARDLPAATIVHPLQLFARVPEPTGRVVAYGTPERVSDVAQPGANAV